MSDATQHCPYCVKNDGSRNRAGYLCTGILARARDPESIPPLPSPGEEQDAARRVLVELMCTGTDERTRLSAAQSVLKGDLSQWTTEEILVELERRAAKEKKP